MMKLSSMKTVFQTVDVQGFSPVADELLSAWEFTPGTNRVVRASSNFIFTFQNRSQKYILRFVCAAERERMAIQAEMDLLNVLANRDMHVNRPIASKIGKLVETIETSCGIYHAVVLEYLQGVIYEYDELVPVQFRKWGKTLAELHNRMEGLSYRHRPTWKSLIADAEIELTGFSERSALNELRKQLEALPLDSQNFGLIHYDFELDNLIWQEDQPGIIDFDDCAACWFCADIALALRDLFGDRASQMDLQHPSLIEFVTGYRESRPLSDLELAYLPLMLGLSNLLKYAELRKILAEPSEPGEPNWMMHLRQKLGALTDTYQREINLFALS